MTALLSDLPPLAMISCRLTISTILAEIALFDGRRKAWSMFWSNLGRHLGKNDQQSSACAGQCAPVVHI
jgi:hypothetical protein